MAPKRNMCLCRQKPRVLVEQQNKHKTKSQNPLRYAYPGLRVLCLQKPRVLVDRDSNVVFQEFEFGRQMLAGYNPSTITALRQMPSEFNSAITEEHVAGGALVCWLGGWVC